MTIWEFSCARAGYAQANKTEEETPPVMDENELAKLGIEGFA